MKHWEYHPEYDETCFGCKAGTLQMNAGDAVRDITKKSVEVMKEIGQL